MTETSGRRSLLDLENITKRFGDLVANDAVTMSVAAGEVVSMLGENGAGKSTLMKIAYGLVRGDAGTIKIEGQEIDLKSPRDAMAAGIGMVTQEFSLVNTMTVAENIALSGVGFGRIDAGNLRQSVESAMERVGVYLPPDAIVGSLSIGEKQRVEIVKALFHDCKVLILDEPTAVLTPQDIEALFTTIAHLKSSGLGVLFVSHKLREVQHISDRVVVLRHGRLVADKPIAEVTTDSLAGLMMGVTAIEETDVDESAALGVRITPPSEHPPTVTNAATFALEIRELSLEQDGARVLNNVSLHVRRGEIFGLAGISGNGQSQLVEVLSGILKPSDGSIFVTGDDITRASINQRLSIGLGRLTEDRRGTTFSAMTVEQNLIIEDLKDFKQFKMLNKRAIRRHAEEMIEKFAIKARPTDIVGNLSGGNIQKVLLARAFARKPQILIAAQPTRGLDIGTYGYVHDQLRALCANGAGVLLISEDLDELRALSDRIAVIFRGEIVGELNVRDAIPERLGAMMTGEREAVA